MTGTSSDPAMRATSRRDRTALRRDGLGGDGGSHVFSITMRGRPRVLALGLALLVGGCLPIRWREPLSPAVVGVYRDQAGMPVAGAQVAVATRYGGQSCARPAVEATTDSAGGFQLPATERRHRYLALWSLDQELPAYSFCAGVKDTLDLVFHGERTWRGTQVDSLACVQTETPAGSRVRCSGYYAWDGGRRHRVDSAAAGRIR